MSKVEPWAAYKEDVPEEVPGFASTDAAPMRLVHHVAHLKTALSIVADGEIRAGLVYDESKLNRSRICVVWLSPNTWTYGSMYGNVSFSFDLKELWKGKRAYWVEAVTKYNPTACRILITGHEYEHLLPYYPESSGGPWIHRKSDDTHWRNRGITLELILDEALPLGEAKNLAFVHHHGRYCSVDPRTCRSKSLHEMDAAARFVAELSACENDIEGVDGSRTHVPAFTDFAVGNAWGGLERALHRRRDHIPWQPDGGNPSNPDVYARAALQAVARQDWDSLETFAGHFESAEVLLDRWADLIVAALPGAVTKTQINDARQT